MSQMFGSDPTLVLSHKKLNRKFNRNIGHSTPSCI